MTTVLDRVAETLFSTQDHRVGNVKFFRGACTSVTAEQLAEQLESANSQIRDNVASRIDDIDTYQPA